MNMTKYINSILCTLATLMFLKNNSRKNMIENMKNIIKYTQHKRNITYMNNY